MKKKLIFSLSLILLIARMVCSQSEEARWKQFVLDPSEQNVSLFVAEYPLSPLMPEVAKILWGRCLADGDKKFCELYIRFFPAGGDVEQAKDIKSRASGTEVVIDGAIKMAETIIDGINDESGDSNNSDDTNTEDDNISEPENEPDPDTGEPELTPPPVPDNNKPEVDKPTRPTGKTRSPTATGNKKKTETTTGNERSSRPEPPRREPTARPATKPAAKPNAVFASLRSEHDIVQNKQKGVLLHLNFTITGYAGKPCAATVHFLDEAKKPIADTNRKYASSKGKVIAKKKFTPKHATTRYKDLKVFMPYGELHKQGKNKIFYYVTIRSGKTTLAKTKILGFNLN